ncbi:MAG: hypothetical protein KF850_42460 [Labilithrix sp.]|nr:hypothetical protein [Labilithrix sp.]MBX3218745.1 hypothetical protein [Labilithrix sp.]
MQQLVLRPARRGRRLARVASGRVASGLVAAVAMVVGASRASRAAEPAPRAGVAPDAPRLPSDEPIPRLPAPFVLPELSHARIDVQLDWFLGRVAPADVGRPGAVAAIVRPSIEASVLVPRRLYVGASYPFAGALPPDGGLAPGEAAVPSGARSILGNVEGHVRAVFPLPTWLEIGFILGVTAPTSTFNRDHRPNRSAVDAVSSLDPTNYVHFLPDRVGLRPAGDLRIVRGPFVLQGRHGIDILIDNEGIDRAKFAGRLLGHVGYLARPDLEVSIEASQIYFFSSDEQVAGEASADRAFAERYRISDARRAAFTAGPALRLALRDVDVGAAVVTNLGDPLSPAAAGFIGLRLSVVGHVGAPGP